MHIQSYQIHNVLNAYRRQLSQGKSSHPQQVVPHATRSVAVTISTEGKNQSILDKVAETVIKKITSVDPGSEFSQEMVRQVQNTIKEPPDTQKDNSFIFNTIVENNQKETRSIAVDNSQVLMNRLDELAKAVVNSKAE